MDSASPRQAGFVLVEVVVSAAIVVILASGTLLAIQATKRSSAEERHRATAHGLAQEDQARMRAFRISALANYTEDRNVEAGDGTYNVSSRADFVTDSTGTASCEQGTASPDYIRISSEVTWPSIGQRPPVLIQSIVAPPNGAIAADRGALAVAVRGGQDQGIPGILLSGTGPASFSGVTSDNGCVIFGNLVAGNYTLTATAPGYVDKDGKPPGTTPAGVVALSTNTLALQLDEPGGVDVAFTTVKDGNLVESSAESVVVFNTGMTAASVFKEPAPLEVLTAEPLFPFASPDTVYAGGCTANNPNPDDVAGAPGEAALASTQVLANQIVDAQIQLPALNLSVRSGTGPSSAGSPVSGARVILTDEACQAEGETVVLERTTDADGELADPGLPWSTFNVCVESGGKASNTSGVEVMDLVSGTDLTVYLGAAGAGSCT